MQTFSLRPNADNDARIQTKWNTFTGQHWRRPIPLMCAEMITLKPLHQTAVPIAKISDQEVVGLHGRSGLVTPSRTKEVLSAKFSTAYGYVEGAPKFIMIANFTDKPIIIKAGSTVGELHLRPADAFVPEDTLKHEGCGVGVQKKCKMPWASSDSVCSKKGRIGALDGEGLTRMRPSGCPVHAVQRTDQPSAAADMVIRGGQSVVNGHCKCVSVINDSGANDRELITGHGSCEPAAFGGMLTSGGVNTGNPQRLRCHCCSMNKEQFADVSWSESCCVATRCVRTPGDVAVRSAKEPHCPNSTGDVRQATSDTTTHETSVQTDSLTQMQNAGDSSDQLDHKHADNQSSSSFDWKPFEEEPLKSVNLKETKEQRDKHEVEALARVLVEFKHLLSDGSLDFKSNPEVRHSRTATITTTEPNPRIYSRAHGCNPEEAQEFKKVIEQKVKEGVIEPSKAQWCSNALLVRKDGKIRMVIDCVCVCVCVCV
jgi:hypothetical protein